MRDQRPPVRPGVPSVAGAPGAAGNQYTTAAILRIEKETVARMQEGNRAALGNSPLVERGTRTEIFERHPQLNQKQQTAADQILPSQDKIVRLDGVAGARKTTTLSVIREAAEPNGYNLEGYTGRVTLRTTTARRF